MTLGEGEALGSLFSSDPKYAASGLHCLKNHSDPSKRLWSRNTAGFSKVIVPHESFDLSKI